MFNCHFLFLELETSITYIKGNISTNPTQTTAITTSEYGDYKLINSTFQPSDTRLNFLTAMLDNPKSFTKKETFFSESKGYRTKNITNENLNHNMLAPDN